MKIKLHKDGSITVDDKIIHSSSIVRFLQTPITLEDGYTLLDIKNLLLKYPILKTTNPDDCESFIASINNFKPKFNVVHGNKSVQFKHLVFNKSYNITKSDLTTKSVTFDRKIASHGYEITETNIEYEDKPSFNIATVVSLSAKVADDDEFYSIGLSSFSEIAMLPILYEHDIARFSERFANDARDDYSLVENEVHEINPRTANIIEFIDGTLTSICYFSEDDRHTIINDISGCMDEIERHANLSTEEVQPKDNVTEIKDWSKKSKDQD